MKVEKIIVELGGVGNAAVRLQVERTAVSMWKKRGTIPLAHLPNVARELGLPLDAVWPQREEAA